MATPNIDINTPGQAAAQFTVEVDFSKELQHAIQPELLSLVAEGDKVKRAAAKTTAKTTAKTKAKTKAKKTGKKTGNSMLLPVVMSADMPVYRSARRNTIRTANRMANTTANTTATRSVPPPIARPAYRSRPQAGPQPSRLDLGAQASLEDAVRDRSRRDRQKALQAPRQEARQTSRRSHRMPSAAVAHEAFTVDNSRVLMKFIVMASEGKCFCTSNRNCTPCIMKSKYKREISDMLVTATTPDAALDLTAAALVSTPMTASVSTSGISPKGAPISAPMSASLSAPTNMPSVSSMGMASDLPTATTMNPFFVQPQPLVNPDLQQQLLPQPFQQSFTEQQAHPQQQMMFQPAGFTLWAQLSASSQNPIMPPMHPQPDLQQLDFQFAPSFAMPSAPLSSPLAPNDMSRAMSLPADYLQMPVQNQSFGQTQMLNMDQDPSLLGSDLYHSVDLTLDSTADMALDTPGGFSSDLSFDQSFFFDPTMAFSQSTEPPAQFSSLVAQPMPQEMRQQTQQQMPHQAPQLHPIPNSAGRKHPASTALL